MITRKISLVAIAAAFMFTSCSNDNDDSIVVPLGDYENGILISHEGNFGQGNASVSFVSNDFSTVENKIFSTVNNALLGDTAQSIAFNGDTAYIVVNVSNKIEVVNRYTFESITTIDAGLVNPRYIAFSNGKGYITNWGDGSNPDDDFIAVFDLATNALETAISVPEGPERIIASGNSVYIAHQGGFSQNNVITSINTSLNSVGVSITVADVPNAMQIDALGNLWVLSGGKPAWTGDETHGSITMISSVNDNVVSFDFATTEHPNYLSLDGDLMYYHLNGSVYKMALSDTSLPTTPEFSNVNFYDMTVRDGMLYGVDALDFASNGVLKVYDLNTNSEVQSITLDIVPGGIYFN